MGYLDCMARVMITHVSEVLDLNNPYIENLKNKTTRDEVGYYLQYPDIQGKRYKYLTESVLEGDLVANDVLDLALANMLYPYFGVAFKQKTGAVATVKNAYLSLNEADVDYPKMKHSYDMLCKVFLADQTKYPFFENPFYIDNRLFGFLSGDDEQAWEMRNYASLYLADSKRAQLQIDGEDKTQMSKLCDSLEARRNIWLLNEDMQEAETILRTAADRCQKNMIFVDIDEVGREKIKEAVALVARESFFYKAYVCLLMQKEENSVKCRNFLQEFEKKNLSVCICGKENMEIFFSNEHYISLIRFPKISRYDRISIWNAIAEQLEISLDAESYARKYPLNRARMEKIFYLLMEYKERGSSPTEEQIVMLCKNISYMEVEKGELMAPNPDMSIDRLVLSEDKKAVITKICNHEWYREQVYQKWGMKTEYIYGNSTAVLFTGPPGTGKTMAAYVISNMLDLPLYKVDLSQIADKYIGETEKHLEKVFDYAQKNHVILFFDEADAIFGKRSEVKDARDRYANNEVSYILQRIEQYDGIVILTSNLKNNIDSAFMRRMKYVIHFAMPDEKERLAIWKKGFPDKLPTEDIDFKFLARQFELSGGNIKNIILSAAFDAAGEQEAVGMKHILMAIRLEYAKYNKTMTPEEFGEYEMMMREIWK